MVRVGVDLSLPEGSVSIELRGELVYSVCWNKPRLHAEVVFNKVEEGLKLVGLSPNDVEEVVVSSGPGSFTGVRLSITVAKAFKVSGKSAKCASTLKALSHGYQNLKVNPVALIPAMRGKFYALVDGKEIDAEPETIVRQLLRLPNPLVVYKGEIPQELRTFPNLKETTPLSAKLLSLPEKELSPDLTPNYVRNHDAKPQVSP